MYIVKQKINGRDYFYLRKSVRTGDKVKSLCIAYLGKSAKEAEEKKKEIEKQLQENPNYLEEMRVSSNIIKDESSPKIVSEPKSKLNHVDLTIDELASFCKRKGFVFKSSEIYGGMAGFWDFGPLGAELFNNIKQDFWNFFARRENMTGIEASIISHPKTWEASGHVSSFSDVAVICKKCKKSTKLDKSEVGKVKCDCGGEYEVQGTFSLLFKINVGALNPMETYLRGETAQGMFLDFKSIVDTGRFKLPFGIVQIGKCFRNEIAPRDFLFRSREFTIAELEFFIHPDEEKCEILDNRHLGFGFQLLDSETQKQGKNELKQATIEKMLKEKKLSEWHAYWLVEQLRWFEQLGLDMKKIKVREHTKDELSHYSSATFDIDYEYPFGSKEIAGNANRGQYDLTQHEKFSKKDMSIFDEATEKKVVPKVIEPTFGIERVFLALICNAFYKNEKGETILKLNPKLAPIKAAIFPLVKTDNKLVEIARSVYEDLKNDWNVVYDESGSVGRRYARNDEAGTPFCITIDSDSIKKNDVTIRNRNTTKQIRIKIKNLKNVLGELINGKRQI